MDNEAKFYGWIGYENAFGCNEEKITCEPISMFEEKYGALVDSGAQILCVHVYRV